MNHQNQITNFSQWLKAQVFRDDPIGDVARDFTARNEHGVYCCRYFHNPQSVRKHILDKHHPCEGAIRSLDKAINEWYNLPIIRARFIDKYRDGVKK